MVSTHIAHPELWSIAFGPRPGVSVVSPRRADPTARWTAAVALGGQGRYAAAAALLEVLAADPRTPRALAAHVAVTRASHLRQLGGHGAAARFDGLGIRLATAAGRPDPGAAALGIDARTALVDGLVGLAADAVGRADAAAATSLLTRADAVLADCAGPRSTIRAGWVRAEIALLRGDPAAAVRAAADAVAGARRWGSARHLLKSRLVAEVAGLVAARAGLVEGAGSAGSARLDAVAEEAGELGLLPLRWAALLAAAGLAGAATDGPPVGRQGPRNPSGAAVRTNERHGRTAPESVNGAASDAARRRHAAAHALSAMFTRSDPQLRRLMREVV
ncbi:hypothetical protein [Pseudonocardia sp.]|jgi:hypothetical protein|uniref:hypothetical protein n=1 Tax=Pseudonocardia sp. TaxID=60912 RepID=UPI0031FDA87F